ncbi:zinc finger protein 502-like [Toxorhynchites rutilus septentrionalis]|uniref:zinc finger protein 502-like n=1 Tax=Toxorhynchites rutilus septentrionalis TaxID=329112 RepID=UPI00247913B4|nr:zinc finger protein 502-like [Toxorhynchites rutilus septentrionalis]
MDQEIKLFGESLYVPMENSEKNVNQLADDCEYYEFGGKTYMKFVTSSPMQLTNIYETQEKTANGDMEQQMGNDSGYTSPMNIVPEQSLTSTYQPTDSKIDEEQSLQNTFVENCTEYVPHSNNFMHQIMDTNTNNVNSNFTPTLHVQPNIIGYPHHLSHPDVSLPYNYLQSSPSTASLQSQYAEPVSSSNLLHSDYISSVNVLSQQNQVESVTAYQQTVANNDAEQSPYNTLVYGNDNNAYVQGIWYTQHGQPIYLVPEQKQSTSDIQSNHQQISPSTCSSSSETHYGESSPSNNSSHFDYQQPSTSHASLGDHIDNGVHPETASKSTPSSDSTKTSKRSYRSKPIRSEKIQRAVRRSVVKHSDFPCTTCGTYLKSRQGLKQHNRSIHSGYEHRCSMCGKRFATEEILDEHIAKHKLTEKPWKCELCPNSYINKPDLKRHLLDHNPATKPHECDKCGKRFSRSDQRDQHMESHERKEAKREQ